jgi:hypothetical protein
MEGKVTVHYRMGLLVLLANQSPLGRRSSKGANDDPMRLVECHLSGGARESLNIKNGGTLENVQE